MDDGKFPEPPRNDRAAAVFRRLTVEKPRVPFTEVTMEDYAACLDWLPAGARWCNAKLSDEGYPNILFAGHWIVPKAE